MSTLRERFALLLNTKAELKAALTEQGQAVGDVLSEYPDAIRAIRTGSLTVSDDGQGNVTISMEGASASYSDGDLKMEQED